MMKIFFSTFFFIALSVIAWMDGKTKKIPDRLLAALFVAGCCSVPFFPEISLTERGLGTFCVSAPLLVMNIIVPGVFGGGDIKLTAVGGMILGWKGMAAAFFDGLFLAGGYAFWLLVGKKKSRSSCFAFGPFLCTGIIVTFFMIFLEKAL